jgi:4a-hydroxytetrahydrobiopterin dehydratase
LAGFDLLEPVLPQGARDGVTLRDCAADARGYDGNRRVVAAGRIGGFNMAKLSTDQITQKLKALPGWEYKSNAISKMFKFKEFMSGIDFVNKVAEIAEAGDHHPDIAINYTRVTFTCSTHSDGGVTDKDFKLAENIEIAFKDRSE